MPESPYGYRRDMALHPFRFSSEEVGAAQEFLRRSWPGVEELDLGSGFRVEASGVGGPGFGVTRLTHTSTLQLEAVAPSSVQVVELLRGHARLRVDGREVVLRPGQVVAVDGHERARFSSDAAALGMVVLSARLLGETAHVSSGRLRFRCAPLTGDAAAHWRAAVRHTSRGVLSRPDAAARPEIVEKSARMLATAALSSFPHDLVPQREPVESGPGAIRRATAYIDAHAAEPLTVGEIAKAAHTSVRALQQGFARHCDTSPTAYLRRVRLEGAHRELVEADASTATVADVAARWGFSQPGRFAAHYRQVYGVLPSETLKSQG